MWNSGPMLGGPGGAAWPRLNRSGFWLRGDAGPGDDPAPLTDGPIVDDSEEDDDGGDDVPGTERR